MSNSSIVPSTSAHIDTLKNLSVSLIVQIYLSIDRPDLAKKEYESALKWAEDDLLLQSIEASIGLVTGFDAYQNASSFYSEQLGNPSLSSSHLLTARSVTRLLRGEVTEAKSDLEEVLRDSEDEEALSVSVVAAGLGQAKKGEADELYGCVDLTPGRVSFNLTFRPDGLRQNTLPILWLSRSTRRARSSTILHQNSRFLHLQFQPGHSFPCDQVLYSFTVLLMQFFFRGTPSSVATLVLLCLAVDYSQVNSTMVSKKKHG